MRRATRDGKEINEGEGRGETWYGRMRRGKKSDEDENEDEEEGLTRGVEGESY